MSPFVHKLLHTPGWRRLLALATTVAGLWGQPAVAAEPAYRTDCPPVATQPTPEQLRTAIAQARDHGFLWRFERDGHAGYLYGTVHVGKLAWAVPGPTVNEALRASDTLALELDFSDPALARKVADSMVTPGADVPPLPPALQARLDRLSRAACLPASGQPHPVMQALALTTLAARVDGLDPAYAQEFALSGFMTALGRKIVSLETPELQMAALVPPDPAEAQRLVRQMVEQLEADRTRGMVVRLADVWARGDLEQLERYDQWCECVETDKDRRQLQRLNDERNPGLAERIDALQREGRRLFVAVGALHMTGPQALPRLLAQRGYTVARVPLR